MSDRTIELTRRRVLGGIVTVGVGGAAAGAGTMAYFTDSEDSTNNTVNSGTLQLSFGGSGSFNFSTALAPTQSTSDTVILVKDGSITGSVDVDVSYTESDASPNDTDRTAQEVAQNLNVLRLEYGGNDLLSDSSQGLPNDPTLADLASNDQGSGESTANDLVDLPDPGSGTDFTFELELANVGNAFQSDGVDIDFIFHLNQTDDQ